MEDAGFGFGVRGLFRVSGFGFWVSGFGFSVQGEGSMIWGPGFKNSRCRGGQIRGVKEKGRVTLQVYFVFSTLLTFELCHV